MDQNQDRVLVGVEAGLFGLFCFQPACQRWSHGLVFDRFWGGGGGVSRDHKCEQLNDHWFRFWTLCGYGAKRAHLSFLPLLN